MTHVELTPYLRAAVDYARGHFFGYTRAVDHAAFVRDAPYAPPEDRRVMRRLFRALRRSTDARVRRFYGFLAACLVMHDREERKA